MLLDFQDSTKSLEERLNDLVSRLTLAEKISCLSTQQSGIERLNIPAYQIGGEAAHGVVDRGGTSTTVFPQPIGLSSTWNKTLLKKVGEAIGDEARAFYYYRNKATGLTLWAPTIDMERDPRWGRTEEAYGEDPFLTGQLSKYLILGMQGEDPFYLKMVAAPKHFFGNNNEHGREYISNSIDARNRFEYYLPAFEPAFTEANAASMMTAYNGVNGIPAMQIKEIQAIVRDQWQMDGFIVSDGGALTLNVEQYHYYDRFSEALADALKKGIDCFVDDKEKVEKAAYEALEQGLITEEDITQAISRIFKVRIRLGQFDQVDPYYNEQSLNQLITLHQPLVEEVTDQSIVLLKNQAQMLPLAEERISSIAVIGPTANHIFRDWYTGYPRETVPLLQGLKQRFINAEISYTDGFDRILLKSEATNKYLAFNDQAEAIMTEQESAHPFIDEDWGWNSHLLFDFKHQHYLSLLDHDSGYKPVKKEVFDWFIKEKISFYPSEHDTTIYQLTSWRNKPLKFKEKVGLIEDESGEWFSKVVVESGIETAVKQAQSSEVAIVCVGNHPMLNGRETEDRPDITLAEYQQRLVKAVYQANPKTILVVIGSYPFAINWEDEHLPAIIYSAHGSQQLGTSLAKIMAGDRSPSGKLSMTWYKSTEALPCIFDYDIIKGKRTYMYADDQILYPFGHGLSYGEVSYKALELSKTTINDDSDLMVTVTVKNQSELNIEEVIQLYASFDSQSLNQPKLKLVGFEKVSLAPKQERIVSFQVQAKSFYFFDVQTDTMRLMPGYAQIKVGSSSEAIHLQSERLIIDAKPLRPRDLSKVTLAERYDDYDHVSIGKGENEQNCVINRQNGRLLYREVICEQVEELVIRAATDGGSAAITLSLDGVKQANRLTIDQQSPFEWRTYTLTFTPTKKIHDIELYCEGPVYIQTIQLKGVN